MKQVNLARESEQAAATTEAARVGSSVALLLVLGPICRPVMAEERDGS